VALADDFRALLQELPTDWDEASALVSFNDEGTARRAAALLLSLNPGQHDAVVRFVVSRRAAPLPDLALRGLRRVDAARLRGKRDRSLAVHAGLRAPVEGISSRDGSLGVGWSPLPLAADAASGLLERGRHSGGPREVVSDLGRGR